MLGARALSSECRFAHHEDRDVVVAARLWEIIDAAVEQRGRASIVLSGGSTPAPVYNLLREMPMPWEQLSVCASDERWVALSHPASNEAMFRRELLGPHADAVEVISLARRSDDIGADAAACDATLSGRDVRWDAVVLGMGADGHTASWFPDAPQLGDALHGTRHCLAITPASTEQARLTLTRRSLLAARQIILLIGGEEKWQVYQRAKGAAGHEELPVSFVLNQDRAPVDVYWSAD